MKSNNYKQSSTVNVSVAIATYNGAKYLSEQLESIAKQTILPDEIIISDDCSNDNTKQIVDSFVKSSTINVKFFSNSVNLGIINNFYNAFSHCSGEYIFYCDQDDVWMPEKIEQCLLCFEYSSQIKLVIHQNNIVDQNLNDQGIIQPNISQSHIIKAPIYRDSVWGFGHQMAFRRTILPMLVFLKDLKETRMSHVATCFDFSIIVAAGLCGDIYLLKKPLVLFRRHSDSSSRAGKAENNLFAKAKNKSLLNNLYIGEIEELITLIDAESFQNLRTIKSDVLYKAMLNDKLLLYKNFLELYTSKPILKYLIQVANIISFGFSRTLPVKKEIVKNIFYSSLLRFTN